MLLNKKTQKSCLTTLVTLYHVKLFSTCYIFLYLTTFISLLIPSFDYRLTLVLIIPIFLTLCVVSTILWIHLSFVWDLAMVLLVIEKSFYGIRVLGKTGEIYKGEIYKGKRWHGLVLSSLVTMATLISKKSSIIILNQKWVPIQIDIRLLPITFSYLLIMVQYKTYTMLYFQCKKIHVESIELERSLESI